MSLCLNKLCDVRDFHDEEFVAVAKWALGPQEKRGTNWPIGYEDRKVWEVTMSVLAAQRHIAPSQRTVAVGVGAGTEATSFILTRLFAKVIASDIYLSPNWEMESPATMLTSPERYAGSIPFERSNLSVRHMRSTDIEMETASCDFVYSSSSIEHFGNKEEIMESAREIGRILRPGGIASISTEYRINGNREWLDRNTAVFTKDRIEETIIQPSGCIRVDLPVWSLSLRTRLMPTLYTDAMAQLPQMESRLQGRWNHYPHIILYHRGLTWTSIQITMRKP